jgi:hypothetical protein
MSTDMSTIAGTKRKPSDDEAEDHKPPPAASERISSLYEKLPATATTFACDAMSGPEEEGGGGKLPPGGLAGTMTEEERKLEEKRAYNRRNAARARKRTKDQLAELCRKVESLTSRSEALEATNSELTKRVVALTEENMLLRRIILDKQAALSGSGLPTSAVAPNGGGMGGGVPPGSGFGYGPGYAGGSGAGGPGGFPFNSMI